MPLLLLLDNCCGFGPLLLSSISVLSQITVVGLELAKLDCVDANS